MRCLRLRRELADRDALIAALREELDRARYAGSAAPNGIDVRRLRRQLAFALHPDRGGDGQLLAGVNVLLDAVS